MQTNILFLFPRFKDNYFNTWEHSTTPSLSRWRISCSQWRIKKRKRTKIDANCKQLSEIFVKERVWKVMSSTLHFSTRLQTPMDPQIGPPRQPPPDGSADPQKGGLRPPSRPPQKGVRPPQKGGSRGGPEPGGGGFPGGPNWGGRGVFGPLYDPPLPRGGPACGCTRLRNTPLRHQQRWTACFTNTHTLVCVLSQASLHNRCHDICCCATPLRQPRLKIALQRNVTLRFIPFGAHCTSTFVSGHQKFVQAQIFSSGM